MPLKQGAKPGRHITVSLFDESPIFCEALGAIIAMEDDLEHVGSASSTDAAVEVVTVRSPDVALVDVDLAGDPGFDGMEAASRIKAVRPETKILVLSRTLDLETMVRAAAAGACGFLSKTSHLPDICEAIRTAKDGGMFVEKELIPTLIERLQATSKRPIGGGSDRAVMTAREQEVLALLGEGLDVTAIARRLKITVNTCRGHVKNIMAKLGSHSQLEAVVEAVHQGLLPHLAG